MNTFVLIGCIMLALSIVILYRSRSQIKVFEHNGEDAVDFRSHEMDEMAQRRDVQKFLESAKSALEKDQHLFHWTLLGVALACASAGLIAVYHDNNGFDGKELFAVTILSIGMAMGCLLAWGILSLLKESS